jgi:hypothetical protein
VPVSSNRKYNKSELQSFLGSRKHAFIFTKDLDEALMQRYCYIQYGCLLEIRYRTLVISLLPGTMKLVLAKNNREK